MNLEKFAEKKEWNLKKDLVSYPISRIDLWLRVPRNYCIILAIFYLKTVVIYIRSFKLELLQSLEFVELEVEVCSGVFTNQLHFLQTAYIFVQDIHQICTENISSLSFRINSLVKLFAIYKINSGILEFVLCILCDKYHIV